jgi:diguanylate cyclase (GGDEF)-like protein
VLALILGIALVPVGLGIAISDHRDQREANQRALANEAGTQAETVRDHFEQSRSLTQVTARNPAFREFYELPGSRTSKVRAQGDVIKDANDALAYVESLFPNSIGEACFIDRAGPENARAVKGVPESLSKLAPDETGAPFFKPAFALRPGQVYQARPYNSPDTQEWVIANATPIRAAGSPTNQAIVHFEVTIESFRRIAAGSDRFDVAIVDARTGRVIVDSRHRQPAGEKSRLGRPADRRFATLARESGPTGELTVGGREGAYERVGQRDQNANDWIVVAVARSPTPSWLSSLGAAELATLATALLLLAFAITMLRSSQRDLRAAALTDPLTALPNRRSLHADLERHLADKSGRKSMLLLLSDLDGFKAYNDNFGHPAGDALLTRLAQKLAAATNEFGSAYRMGGDEFCALLSGGAGDAERLEEITRAALSEDGDGFMITASCGSVLLPAEAADPDEALRKADQRMYAQKNSGRASAARQSTDVLVRVLAERSPELGAGLGEVASLCQEMAKELGLPEEEIITLVQAASVHDIGKAAIPDAILSKRGPLDLNELEFIRGHTIVGERIMGAAPALAKAGKLVRSSHERFDGNGYPDGIKGDEIPIGSRVIAVADAWHAMTSDRPYRSALTPEAALAELHRCAGGQFDPAAVRAFDAIIAARRRAAHVPLSV